MLAQESAENEVFMGLILNRERLSSQIPEEKENVKVLILDDALYPEEIEEEALGTKLVLVNTWSYKKSFVRT